MISDASTSLVIIPEKYGNIAHYLSGINNSKKESRKKQVLFRIMVLFLECTKCTICN